MLFPPQIFLIFWSHCCQQVVSIHDDMNEGVQHSKEGGMATRSELYSPPNGGRHNAMVDNVQIGDLIKLLPQDKENRIQKLGEFAEVIPPTHLGDDQLIWVIGIVDRLATKAIAEQPCVYQALKVNIP